MEKKFRFSAMLAACFVIYLLLPSCADDHNFTGKTGKKLNGPIRIIRYDISDGSLTLRDNSKNNAVYALVSRSQPIDWNVTSKASDVEIVSIEKDPNYQYNDPNFFSDSPHKVGQSRDHWQARIGSPDPKTGIIFEKYLIKWQLKGKPEIYTFDPLLQLNPQ